jgi:hypothetical protein
LRFDREAAADAMNVSERSVNDASAVLDHGVPELQEAVTYGHIAVSVAAKAAKLTAADQREIAAKGNRKKPRVFPGLQFQ